MNATNPPRRMRWLRRCAAPAIALAVCAGVLYGLSRLPGRNRPAPTVDAPVVNVSVLPIRPVAALPDAFTLKGAAEPWAVIRLSTETPGRIREIGVREGQSIRLGQPMVLLETDVLAAAAAQARAQAQFDRREAERLQALRRHNPDAVSETELDRMNSAVAISAAAAELAAARLDQCRITAPQTCDCPGDPGGIAGVLNALPVKVGQLVQPGDLVAEIVESRFVKIVIDLPERDVRYVTVGQSMPVVIEALDDRRATGTVHFIRNTADPRTRTYRAEIKLPNPRGDIRPGMIARVRVLRRTLHDVLVVPLQAVIPLERGYEVFINDGGVARRRQIGLGPLLGRGAAVVRPAGPGAVGLAPGDRLIVKDPRLVGDGQAVREVPDPQPARALEELLNAANASGAEE